MQHSTEASPLKNSIHCSTLRRSGADSNQHCTVDEREEVFPASAAVSFAHSRSAQNAHLSDCRCAGSGDARSSPTETDELDHKPSPSHPETPRCDGGGGPSHVGSLEGSSLSSIPSLAAAAPTPAGSLGRPAPSHHPPSAPNSVSIVLTDGGSLEAEPYEHSVSGHHIMLSEKGKIWKATRANREARFYERVNELCAIGLGDAAQYDPVLQAESVLTPPAGRQECPAEVESATLLHKFLPRYYGTRKVLKLRCGKQATQKACLEKEAEKELARLRLEQFPALPADGPYDASAPHTARDVVQSFMVEQRHSPAAPASTMHSPGSGSGSGDDLGKALPRTEERFVDMIVLEDVCDKMEQPCVLDVKMGTRQYGVDAPIEKRRSKNAKTLKSTSGLLGLRIAGLKMFDRMRGPPPHHVQICRGKAECRYLGPLEVEQLIFDFCQQSEALCGRFFSLVEEVRRAFQVQSAFRFFTSSLLLVYDAARDQPEATARVVMVDFAYTYTVRELAAAGDEDHVLERDEAFIKGLDSLAAMLSRNANHNSGDASFS
jgi:hypothetical protein